MGFQRVFELVLRPLTQVCQDVPGRLRGDRRRRIQCLCRVVESGEDGLVLVRLSKLLPAPKRAKCIVEDRRRLAGTVLDEHLHCTGFEVDVSPPQAVSFLIIRNSDEFRAASTGVGEQEDECLVTVGRHAVDVEAATETVTVHVADNGPGVPDSQKAEIFGRGEMGAKSHGSGIGLYLVNTLVNIYEGEVTVEDRGVWLDEPELEGSVFSVTLQRA